MEELLQAEIIDLDEVLEGSVELQGILKGDTGETGPQGERGYGCWVSTEEPPEGENILVWFDASDVDTSSFVTKEEMDSAFTDFADDITVELEDYARLTDLPDLSDYALKSEIPAPIDTSNLALKSEIPDVSNFATKDEIPEVPDVSAFQTEEQVTALINSALGVIENGSY